MKTGEAAADQVNKSFLLLFFKKEVLYLLCALFPSLARAATPAQIADGRMIATTINLGNCDACHQFSGAVEAGNIGPKLSKMKIMMPDRRMFYAIIDDEQARNPQTIMPPFGRNAILTPKQIDDVIDFFYTK